VSDYDTLLAFLDPFFTMRAIADLKEEQGKTAEAEAWRTLAAARRFPSTTEDGKYRWAWGVNRNRNDIMPAPLGGKAPPVKSLTKLYEKTVKAMVDCKDKERMMEEFKRMRGDK